MTELRCTIRHRDGTASTADVIVRVEPSAWCPDDAKETLWGCVRALETAGVYRVGLVEVERAVSWRIEVATAAATLTTPALRLSSVSRVWLEGAAFELPFVKGTH